MTDIGSMCGKADDRPEIEAVATEDSFDQVGLGHCTKITFGQMNGSMDHMPTIQIWNGEVLGAEFNAAHATRIIYKNLGN